MADIPTGTGTFLFTDIEGSTSMAEQVPMRMQDALARHDRILRKAVEDHGGYVFKTTGDAFGAAFAIARHALEATLAAQRALFVEKWNENTIVRVRMALHTSATEERDGDYFAPPVNQVAWDFRGGKIVLSLIATTGLDLWYHQNYYHDDSEGDLGDSSKVDDLVPGVLLGVSTALLDQYPDDTEDQVLDLEEANYSDTCEYDSRNDYDDGTYKGRYDVWKNCGPNQNGRVFVLAALPRDQSYLTVVQVVAASEADLEAQKHVLDTFKVSGDV